MKFICLDEIVKSVLLKKGYPMHYYLQFLVSARDIMQTLIYDDGLLPPNTCLLCVDKNGQAKLPCDFIDDIEVGVQVGQYIRPLVRKDELTSLPLRSREEMSNGRGFELGYLPNMFFTTSYFNNYGEFLGRMNIGAGAETDIYKIIPEKGIIQFSRHLARTTIVLIYVSGGNGNCTTMGIDPYAKEVIEAYIIFDRVRNTRGAAIAERQLAEQEYFRQRKIYRARKNKLGIEEIRRAFQRAYYAAPKTS